MLEARRDDHCSGLDTSRMVGNMYESRGRELEICYWEFSTTESIFSHQK
jgi:hypothetical protein